jgi:hypothetical protein
MGLFLFVKKINNIKLIHIRYERGVTYVETDLYH